MRAITFIFIFFLIGAFYIISEKKLNVVQSEDLEVLKSEYGGWLIKTAKGTANLIGNVVNLEWLPRGNINSIENNSNSTNSSG